MASTFTLETHSCHPPDRLFDLSLSIDAHLGSMSDSGERAVGGVTSGQIGLGEQVTWRARHVGIWFTMTSRIVELDRPHRFVDRQVKGPFRSFVHEHTFAASPTGSVMVDTITLAAPVFGRPAEAVLLVPYLRHLIRTRNDYLLGALDAQAR
ncbi:SRPBCC family protein [Ruania zhangjianzhongii]|uniref:SRPBCC family protein n=1 Tax=Ruania zhangjianzhongii TaxID=2603206 RepID=UPI0011C90B0A|nr:SRPBCC family protein [Ruania zhangjianzhongii]